MEKIGDGAEAIIYKDINVIKDRVKKSYRHPDIDLKLRKFRTRREAKVLTKLQELKFPSPILIKMDDKFMKIEMEHISGPKLRDKLKQEDYKKLSKEIGKLVAFLHNNTIIHGDLTTSNMLLDHDKLFFIDFGLSFFSHKVEDQAVDIHLFKQALESKHYKIAESCWKEFLKGYQDNNKFKEVMERLEKVELRGRYKHK